MKQGAIVADTATKSTSGDRLPKLLPVGAAGLPTAALAMAPLAEGAGEGPAESSDSMASIVDSDDDSGSSSSSSSDSEAERRRQKVGEGSPVQSEGHV